METSKRALSCIYKSIDSWNKNQKEEKFKILKSIDTEIFGENSILDSLGIIHFIVSIEDNIKEEFNIDISLANEKVISEDESPFKNVKLLNEYISSLIQAN